MTLDDPQAIRLRPATPDDAAEFARLLADLGYPSTPEQARAGLLRIHGSADYRTVLAEADGEVLGMMGLQRGWGYEHDQPLVRVLALVVRAHARRRGVGARLMAAADDFARAHGAHAMHLTTSAASRGGAPVLRGAGLQPERVAVRALRGVIRVRRRPER